jgi:hypothetical protein
VLPADSHGHLKASEVRGAVRGGEDEFGVYHCGSARDARQRLCQARQAPIPVVAAATVEANLPAGGLVARIGVQGGMKRRATLMH